MADKHKIEQAIGIRRSEPRHGWRDRLLVICEHLLILIAFLVFLSFVQSVMATQQELDAGLRVQSTASGFNNTGIDETHGRDFGQQPTGADHARA